MSLPLGRTPENCIDLTDENYDDHMDVNDITGTPIDLTGDVDKDGVELDVQHYGHNEVDDDEYDDEKYDDDEYYDDEVDDGRAYITIDNDLDFTDTGRGSETPIDSDDFPAFFELEQVNLSCGIVKPGDVVELIDRSERVSQLRLSGDFLRVNSIHEDLDTGETTLHGYRMRRCSYLQPLFDNQMNELFILIEAKENDSRPTIVQGKEAVAIEEVLRKRRCDFTNASRDAYTVANANRRVRANVGQEQLADWIFYEGTLVCRYVHTVIVDKKGKSYSGELRMLYAREKLTMLPNTRSSPMSGNSTTSRSPRIYPSKMSRYSFGDGYCGVGGASQGARQAGLFVKWGLERWRPAIEAYEENFPKSLPLLMDARDFPCVACREIYGVDVLHLSTPCCFWSDSHTVDGKDDQENMETILTVEPILKKIKPRYATLEQAPGLLRKQEHRKYFRFLLAGILSANYNVRWKITDQSEYGLPQRRRRLVFLCAKQGLPLLPFPKPTHGSKGSGLKYWNTVGNALEPLNRHPPLDDPYHQPQLEKVLNLRPVDPFTILAKCITTNGGDNAHPSGKRRYTPRELGLLQGFPIDYQFIGSRSDAKKQAGNAWAPLSNQKYFLLIAQFLEAFDLGLIHAEEDIDDLYDHLQNVEIELSLTRYLKYLSKTVRSKKKHLLWGRNNVVEAAPRSVRHAAPVGATRKQRQVQDEAELARQSGVLIELDDKDDASQSGDVIELD